jgi:hypothetical protein
MTFDRNDLSVTTVPLASLKLTMAPPVRLDNTPAGTRVIVEFTKAEWEGQRLRAKQKGATSADWLTVGPDGTGWTPASTGVIELSPKWAIGPPSSPFARPLSEPLLLGPPSERSRPLSLLVPHPAEPMVDPKATTAVNDTKGRTASMFLTSRKKRTLFLYCDWAALLGQGKQSRSRFNQTALG